VQSDSLHDSLLTCHSRLPFSQAHVAFSQETLILTIGLKSYLVVVFAYLEVILKAVDST